MKNKKIEIMVISFFIIIQSLIFVFVGMNKEYIHMDEAYSLGLASYKSVEIQDNDDFYNHWHNKYYYEDYLSVQPDEFGKYNQVYENQKNDVHPPFYYLFLRISMGFTSGHFSMWSGIIFNIIVFVFITILMYLILKKLFKNEKYSKEKAILLAFIASITLSSLTNVIYIRMYALATLWIVLTLFLHIKLWEADKVEKPLLLGIGVTALLGSLTHYYYLFFLVMMYFLFFVKYIKESKYKELGFYTLAMVIAGICSLVLFPYSINHMFFGYRGQGVLANLTNATVFISNVYSYLCKVNRFGFHNLFFVLLFVMILLMILKKIYKKKNIEKREERSILKLIFWPTLFYFIMASIASPWIELRYIMPICGLIFIFVIYLFYQLLNNFFHPIKCNILMMMFFVLFFISPFLFKIEPEVLYSDKLEIVEKLEHELNVPTIYFFNSQHNRFLDDILLFSKIDESYIAKDMENRVVTIPKILEKKDVSKGIIVFINELQKNDEILQDVLSATGLNKIEYLKRLNACDVYYIS